VTAPDPATADGIVTGADLLRDQSWRPRMGGDHPARDAVAAAIRERIADGTYPAGSLLPAMRVLAAEFSCSLTPVQQARHLLDEEGLVRLKRGSGCTVRGTARPVLREGLLLDALRWAWGAAYQISVSAEGTLEAWRTDGSGTVTAASTAELRDAIRADYPKYAAGVAL